MQIIFDKVLKTNTRQSDAEYNAAVLPLVLPEAMKEKARDALLNGMNTFEVETCWPFDRANPIAATKEDYEKHGEAYVRALYIVEE